MVKQNGFAKEFVSDVADSAREYFREFMESPWQGIVVAVSIIIVALLICTK